MQGDDGAAAPSPAVDNAADDVNNLALSEVRLHSPPFLARPMAGSLTLTLAPWPTASPLSRTFQGSIKEGFLTKQGGTFKVWALQASARPYIRTLAPL